MKLFTLIAAILLISFPISAYSETTWQLLFQPRQRIVKTIGIYNEQIFVGTGNGVFVSKDNGKTWKDFGSNKLQKDANGNSLINWAYIDTENKKIYIATSFGAYYSNIKNPDWHKFFESTKAGSNNIDLTTEDIEPQDDEELQRLEDEDFSQSTEVNSITVDNDQAYLSTNDGFWICNLTSENKCQRINEGLEPDNESGNYEVFYTLKANNELFLGTSNGIYKLDNKNLRWIKLSNNIQKLDNGRINARYLYLDKEKNLWAPCGTGVYISYDRGGTWEKRSDGIKKNNDGFQEAFYLFENEDELYGATASGIYYLNKEQNLWQNISEGVRTKESTRNVYWLANINNDLYAATDEGLFVAHETNSTKEAGSEFVLKGKVEAGFASLEDIEPTVIEVQKQALKFAALPTDSDYKRYRMQARLRNLAPRVGFDINTTGTNTNYFQFENGISANTSLSNDYNAGNTKRFQHDGKLYKQLSVTWDTNQLIYDEVIWRILNQARLTANIKENLLDDVTKIYYQRKRLQLDTLLSPPQETQEKLEKQLQIAELTGQLDSRTGGWFSKEIERRKQMLVRRNGKT